jgi:hypothetical protein
MPIAVFPSFVGVFIWLVLNVFILARIIFIIRTHFEIIYTEKKRNMILWFLIALYMSRFVELNFHHAQMTIFLLWCMLESLKLSDEHSEVKAGIIIGLGTIIKIMPVVMIPYFIYRGKFVSAFVSIFTVVVCFFLPIFVLGQDQFWITNQDWFHILRPDNSDFLWDNIDYYPQNISAFLYRLLMKTDAPYFHNIFSFDYDIASKIVLGVTVLLILTSLYFLATLPFKYSKSKGHTFYEISYIALIMPLIFPHQMKYAFCFLLPAICCLMKVLIDGYNSEKNQLGYRITFVLVLLSFILCTLTTDLILGMHYSIVTQYLKTITVGTLLLIPALMINKGRFVTE